MFTRLLLLLALSVPRALAAEDDDDFEFETPSTPSTSKKPTPPVDEDAEELEDLSWSPTPSSMDDDPPEDDRDLRGLVEERDAPRCPDPAPKVSATGKAALADNYPIQIVSRDLDAVTVELPVLLSQSRADFTGEDGWLIAEVLVDGARVTETRSRLARASLAELSPTFLWLKAQVPVSKPTGTVELKLSRQPEAGQPTALFSRKAEYKL